MKALVLSGGGAHGAWQVGVIRYLIGTLRLRYELYSGVSVGAINATHLAHYCFKHEYEAATTLDAFWRTIDNKKVKKHRWLPYLSAIWNNSVYKTTPLRQLIENNIKIERIRSSGKKLRLGAASLTRGDFHLWTEKDPDLIDGIMASCAFPGIFETPYSRGQYWVDGGVRNVAPLKAAIDAGASNIDVVLVAVKGMKQLEGKKFKSYEVLTRSFDIMMDELIENDIKVCGLKNNISGYRQIKLNVYRPSQPLLGDGLDFNPARISEEIKLGYNDARETYHQRYEMGRSSV